MSALDPRRPFTASAARAAGVPRWRLQGAGFQRLLTGVYVGAGVPVTTATLTEAALLVAPAGAVVSHHTAAALWGAIAPHSPDVHLSLPDMRRMVTSGVRSHRPVTPLTAVMRRGMPVTTPERTFLDLAAELELVDLVVLGDSLIHLGTATPDTLCAAAAEHRGRGARLAREAAALVRAGAESAMESRVRLLVVLAGLPEPATQYRVRTAHGSYRLDLAWPSARVALEYDGRHHIEREAQWARDLGRRESLEADGWRFVVTIAGDVFATPEATLRRVVQALGQGGLRTQVRSSRWRRHFPGRPAAA